MRRIVLLGLVGGIGVAGLLIAVWPGAEADSPGLRPDDRAEVQLGAAIYAAQCASCHGAGLEGQPDWRSPGPDGALPAPPHDATGHTWHHDDATLITLTRDGVGALLGPDMRVNSGMPVFKDVLTDAEIRAALSYIKSTWPAEVRATHDAINARAEGR
ncbi:c-type cytochrome [Jannaschia rubra]|uniref:Cytochrome c, mono-and diheme variants n=1 Tax=Jannaschia rubra TaxID=282197 RepID=A0A0M6XKF9_9RHOB|nr:cytochrome c [Jannaschia rubra]CTQ31418.1 Cytochrome c, mono-and diheme variants [Jannaschia rubra]SFF79940.1 Cytochrome C oxidase, cbb3-type, subunit III [Jannaschia rubra]